MDKIRYASEEDIPFIIQGIKEISIVEKQKPDKDVMILKFIKLALKKNEIKVISKDKKVIGFIQFKFTNKNPYGIEYGKYERRFCWVDWWYIAKDYRNKGFGKILHQDIISLCKRKKIKEVMLDVFHVNSSAFGFYKKEGFSEFIHIMREKIT